MVTAISIRMFYHFRVVKEVFAWTLAHFGSLSLFSDARFFSRPTNLDATWFNLQTSLEYAGKREINTWIFLFFLSFSLFFFILSVFFRISVLISIVHQRCEWEWWCEMWWKCTKCVLVDWIPDANRVNLFEYWTVSRVKTAKSRGRLESTQLYCFAVVCSFIDDNFQLTGLKSFDLFSQLFLQKKVEILQRACIYLQKKRQARSLQKFFQFQAETFKWIFFCFLPFRTHKVLQKRIFSSRYMTNYENGLNTKTAPSCNWFEQFAFIYLYRKGGFLKKKMGLNKSIQKEENSGKIFSNG